MCVHGSNCVRFCVCLCMCVVSILNTLYCMYNTPPGIACGFKCVYVHVLCLFVFEYMCICCVCIFLYAKPISLSSDPSLSRSALSRLPKAISLVGQLTFSTDTEQYSAGVSQCQRYNACVCVSFC